MNKAMRGRVDGAVSQRYIAKDTPIRPSRPSPAMITGWATTSSHRCPNCLTLCAQASPDHASGLRKNRLAVAQGAEIA